MANIYARETALKNVVGRSDYISNSSRQEEIVFHKKNMVNSWQDYSDFEKQNKKSVNENIEARETVVALPNDLYQDKQLLQKFCDRLAEKMYGNNRDYEYAVHWNSSRTNLHAHFIYSERERNLERKPKIYKRDIWADSKTGRTCKKDSPNAVLRCKKGDIQRDKDGNIKYEDSLFTPKDTKYKNKNWLQERNKLIQGVFREFKHDINIFDRNTQIAQKKLTKGSSREFKDYASEYNRKAREANQLLEKISQAEPILKELENKNGIYAVKQKSKRKLVQDDNNKNFIKKIMSAANPQIVILEKELKAIKSEILPLFQKVKTILDFDSKANSQPQKSFKEWLSQLKGRLKSYQLKMNTNALWINDNHSFPKYLENKANQKEKRIENDKKVLDSLKKPKNKEFSLDNIKKINQELKEIEQKNAQRKQNRSKGMSR